YRVHNLRSLRSFPTRRSSDLFVPDSREGISDHRKEVMEIMSRGGGVGTNGSTLRPRNTLARGVNGKSSGSVSWLDDIAQLTQETDRKSTRLNSSHVSISYAVF